MLGWIVALILFFFLVVVSSLFWFEWRENVRLWKKVKEIEETDKYKLKKRAEGLERYVTQFLNKKKPDTVFAATLEKVGMDSIEESLHAMIGRAQFEILLVTPWIKEGIWERIRGSVFEFVKNGGELKVFIKGTDDDFRKGRSDRSVVKEIEENGGVVKNVPQLHAKVYVVDQREALICSANLSRSGLDFSYEAGVWTCNPSIMNEVYNFIEKFM